MAYKISPFDKLTEKLAPFMRKMKDVHTYLTGTRTTLLRIAETSRNDFGDITYEYQTEIIDNVIINYPYNQVELFGLLDTSNIKATGIDILELLPITLQTSFYGSSGQVANNIDINDILVDTIYDEKWSPIPIIMKVSRQLGSFTNKHIVSRNYELTLVRGTMESGIQEKIDEYVSIEAERYTSGVIPI